MIHKRGRSVARERTPLARPRALAVAHALELVQIAAEPQIATVVFRSFVVALDDFGDAKRFGDLQRDVVVGRRFVNGVRERGERACCDTPSALFDV